jgi:ribonuclease P protein component
LSEPEPVEDLGFRRQHRLLKPTEFADVFATRRVLRGVHFALHYKDNGLPHARLGLVIPKKLAHAAVLRNAIKRQMREVFRMRRFSLPARDLVLRLTQPVTKPDKQGWRGEIAALLDLIGKPDADAKARV